MGVSLPIKANSENSPLKLWEIGPFSSYVPIFHLSIPKIWQAHPNKNYIFKINKGRSITSPNFRVLKLEVVDSGKIWNWVIFDDIFTSGSVDVMVTM